MNRFHGSLPDEIWQQLKEWARVHARSNAPVTRSLCSARVTQIVKQLTGRPDTLPTQAVEFYAKEAVGMIQCFRETPTKPIDFETAI